MNTARFFVAGESSLKTCGPISLVMTCARWTGKVTARTGKPHIKRYIEEREQFIYLLVDVSASMRLDDGGIKHKTVVEISALITM